MGDFVVPVVNMACDVPHEHAVKLAKMQVQAAKDNGIRSDLVGIEAMCVLSGLRDEPAIMPTAQAIKYVNIVTGQAPGSKRNMSRSSGKGTRHRQN